MQPGLPSGRPGTSPVPHQPHPQGVPPAQAEARRLVHAIQRSTRFFVLGFFAGIPLTFGGVHFGLTQQPTGFVAALAGLVALGAGCAAFARVLRLRRSLRALNPDAWRSPVAHLPVARRAATLAAGLNGLLVVFGLGALGWLLLMGADWGAYGNSYGFAALMLAAALPLGLALAAASTVPQLLQVIPAGARVGQALYGVFFAIGSVIFFKNGDVLPKAVGGAVALVSLGAMKLLGGAARRMRGGPQPVPGPPPAGAPPSFGTAAAGHGPAAGAPGPAAPVPPRPGMPPTVPQPYAPTRPGGGGRLAAVLVMVLLVGAGAGAYWAHDHGLLGGTDRTVADTTESPNASAHGIDGERKETWAVRVPRSGNGKNLLGTLVSDRVVAGVYTDTIAGYDLTDGKPLWTVKARPGLRACAVSPTTEDGIGAVLYRSGSTGACIIAAAVDLNSGKQLWNKPLPTDKERAWAKYSAIGIDGGVVVSGTYTVPVALDARTGRVLWTGPVQRTADGEERPLENVRVQDGRLMASYAGERGEADSVILRYDLTTGRVLGKLDGPPVTEQNRWNFSVRLVHLDPLVAAVPERAAGNSEIFFSRTGDEWTQLRTQDVRGKSARSQRDEGTVVNGTFVKGYTVDDPSLGVRFDTVVAGFDLTTGEVAWQHRLNRSMSEAVLFPDPAEGVVRAVVSDYDTGLQLYAFPLDSGDAVRGGRVRLSPDSGVPARLNSLSYAAETKGGLVVWNEAVGVLAAFPHDPA